MTRSRCPGLLAGALLGGAWAPCVWAACGADLPPRARLQAEARGLQVAFAPKPWPVVVGRHFAVDVVVCAAPGTAVPDALRIDADMPAHRHGMNYRASVEPRGDGRFGAEGLMFHMPGRWRFIFDVGRGAQAVRVTHEVDVE